MKLAAKNISYTFISNIIGLLVSTVLVIVVPRYISVEKYGFWQLYIFYSSYTNYLSLGLTDGIYLRNAGKNYNSLNMESLKSQFLILTFFNFLITIIYAVASLFIFDYSFKHIIIFFSLISALVVVPRSLFTFVLQATNRIKEYSFITLSERLIYFLLVCILLLNNVENVELLILSDIFAKIVTYIYIFYICKEIIFAKTINVKATFINAVENINIGSKLLIANLSSMLIIGILRFTIERIWNIETFGKVSLTLSISNMLMIFINSVGIVLLPIIKNLDISRMKNLYKSLRLLLTSVLFVLMLMYFPMSEIIKLILPKYNDSIRFIALLFPMCIFEGKMAMLINTYMKALRLEMRLMKYNMLAVLFSCFLSIIFGYLLKNLNLTVLSIVISLMFKCFLSENYLVKQLELNLRLDLVIDIVMTGIFILIAWFVPIFLGFIMYMFIISIYLFAFKNKIKIAYDYLREEG